MKYFSLHNNEWYGEQIPLAKIANALGTPCYVYSKAALLDAWHNFQDPLNTFSRPYQINYAVKANSTLSILNILAKLGSGFDIVSEGELERVLKAGGTPEKIVFSGVGKSTRELTRAIEIGIGCIDIESRAELLRLNEIASDLNKFAPIAIRVNPDVSAETHPYISTGLKENKFGVHAHEALALFLEAQQLSHITIKGIAFHIGSQITTLPPFIHALEKVLQLIDELNSKGIFFKHINVGGGLGVRYSTETPPSPKEYIEAISHCLSNHHRKEEIHLEPGRAMVAHAGVLLTRVEYLKDNFAIVDASMNDLLRPALYGAYQEIISVQPHPEDIIKTYDVVGPICETSDFLGKGRNLGLKPGDLLAVLSAGAYGFSMSSNYNSRPRAAEVLIDGDQYYVIRPRERIEDLFNTEISGTGSQHLGTGS